jgi:hypothetical protein
VWSIHICLSSASKITSGKTFRELGRLVNGT